MRSSTFLRALGFTTLAASAIVLPADPRSTILASVRDNNKGVAAADQQIPMDPGSIQPPQTREDDDTGAPNDSGLTISDILPKSRSINIFASLTRDVATISNRLDSTGATDNTTLLAPLNSAMQALPRKPWEDRPGDTSGISAASHEDKAAQNIQLFVEEHMIPKSPWAAGPENKLKTLGGQEIWWENRDGKRVIQPGNVEVDAVVGRVGNGEVWALRGVVNYA